MTEQIQLKKSMYDASEYWEDAQFSKAWQPGGDWYQSIYETLQANGGSYYVTDPYGRDREIKPDDLYSMSLDTDTGEELRQAITFDNQQENYENDIDNADCDLKDEGKVLVARGYAEHWDGTDSGWLKPGLTMRQLIEQSQNDLESEIQSIGTDHEGRLHINLVNHDGESEIEVRECTPQQAERLTTLLDNGEEAQADKVWQRLKTPQLPDAFTVVETKADLLLEQTARKAMQILDNARLDGVYNSLNKEKHTVRISMEYGRIHITIPAGANRRTIIAKTLTAMAKYNPKVNGDDWEEAQKMQHKFVQVANRLLANRSREAVR